MRQSSGMRLALAAVCLLAMTAGAADADLPNLSTVTDQTKSSTAASSTAKSTKASTTGKSTTSAATTDATSTGATSTGASSSTGVFHLTGVPSIAGAGIPTMIVPYTADAPFMQKATLPEGTVFIAVGAILGFLGFCVVAWRGMVAYAINQSVKKAALASVMASDTKGGWPANPFKPSGGFYKQAPDGSSMSLDALTSAGRQMTGVRDKPRVSRNVAPSNGSGLFFSPTASATTGDRVVSGMGMGIPGNRSSNYLPAGYYASPSAQAAGGAQTTTLGSLSPLQARAERGRSMISLDQASPPVSPGPHARRQGARNSSLAPIGSRDSSRVPSRPTSNLLHPSGLHSQPSNSSLLVGNGHGEDGLPGSRAPSAYLEDLFENHGNGPRERF